MARAGAAGLRGPDQPRWLKRLDSEIDNVRSALAWSITPGGDAELGLALAGTLWWFCWASGRIAEGRRWQETLLSRANRRTVERAEALTGVAALTFFAGDFAAALPAIHQAMADTQALSLVSLFAYAQVLRGSIALLNENTTGADFVAASVEMLRRASTEEAWFLGTADA